METMWLRAFAWFFLFSGVAYYFLVARRFEIPELSLTSHIEVLTMIAVAESCLFLLYTRMSNKIDLGPGLRRLRAKVQNEDAVPVSLDVIQQGVVTGSDEGFFWLEDGTLFFKGLQTVFRLNSEDVPPLKTWPRKWRPSLDKGKPPRNILVVEGERTLRVRLKLIDPFQDYHARRRSATFDRHLIKWLALKPEGSLETLLPPLELHDALRHLSPFRFEGLGAGILMLVLNLVLLFSVKLDFSQGDLLAVARAFAVAACLILVWVSLQLVIARARDLRVRHDLALRLPKAL